MKYLTKKEAMSFLFAMISEYDNKTKPFVIAIDGCSASGKTTFASELADVLRANDVHTDDFFRPRNENGELELSDFSGNFDLVRFKTEAVDGMLGGADFSVGIFDCKIGKVIERRNYKQSGIFVVEGAYSTHPDLGKYWGVSLFFTIDSDEQKKRILNRDGADSYEMFKTVWIPAEERYFKHFDIVQKSDAVISSCGAKNVDFCFNR